MSQHSSLRSDKKGGHYRNVLKRWEKLRHLLEKDKWNPDEGSVFSLPKIKRIKIKIKKKKSEETKEEETVVASETEVSEDKKTEKKAKEISKSDKEKDA